VTAVRSRVAVAITAVVAVALAARLLPIVALLHAFQDRMSGLGVVGLVLYAVVYVVAAVLFVPGSVLTLGAGLAFGFWRAFFVVSAASTTAAALAFLIARHLARSAVERWAMNSPRFQAIERAIAARGGLVVLLLRLSPVVPFSLSNYLYGLTPVRFGIYVLASWIGMIPGTALYVYLGSVGRAVGETRTPAEWALLAGGIAATAAVTVLIGRAAKKELAKAAVPTS
jgi:uncharacterized membrane protein YdjX (TVP38/TMEM64 family)